MVMVTVWGVEVMGLNVVSPLVARGDGVGACGECGGGSMSLYPR